jgi:hypothetical protein
MITVTDIDYTKSMKKHFRLTPSELKQTISHAEKQLADEIRQYMKIHGIKGHVKRCKVEDIE